MKHLLASLMLGVSLTALADGETTAPAPLQGFEYGVNLGGPSGEEWQSPERLSLNKLQPTAYMFHFATPAEAQQVRPGGTYYQLLDGTWKFHWVAQPKDRPVKFYEPTYDVSQWDDIEVPGCWNVQGLQKDGTMKYGVPIYVNIPVIFYHEVAVDDWKKGVMRPAPESWTVHKHPNEVGSYRRTFTVPSAWKGRQVLLHFDGVDSFFYLWINGRYVGFSKNSRNTASFDITPYIYSKGENTIAVEVYRSSDASMLESQDMFRLPGIIRSTYLTSVPQTKINDLAIRTQSIGQGEARLTVDCNLLNVGQKTQKGLHTEYALYPVKMYSDEIEEVAATAQSAVVATLTGGGSQQYRTEVTVQNPRLWSAEAPHRYVLVAELKDKKGKVLDRTSAYFGIRKVEIRETPASEDEFGKAGRYFYVNNKPVKLKGVNRHETSLDRGHAITHEQMEQEVMLMKRGNINHVRLSHYCNDPYFYYLADKYGLYLEDECNLESHQYHYGNASLSHPKEWRAAHVARNMEMVRAHVNHPSIVIWSLGNEAGPGENFVHAYNAIKAYDTSRPVQYERNNDIVDMGSNQYPSVSWVQWVAQGTANVKYPYHISEYAHSMGNSMGNLVDYWNAMESTNYFCGGAIWDWVDQAINTYTADGTRYNGYGGDHGDWPNNGMFCMNGIVLPDFTPKPQYYEVKKVYQNVGVTLEGVKEVNGKKVASFRIFNKNYFEPLDYDLYLLTVHNGKTIKEEKAELSELIRARKSQVWNAVVDMKEPGEYFLNVEFRLKKDMPWAKAGYVQMNEQLALGNTTAYADLNKTEGKATQLVQDDKHIKVSGEGFTVDFDNAQGGIHQLTYGGKTIIEAGNGPRLDAYRAPVDNDNWARDQWFHNGLHNLQHKTMAKPIVTKEKNGSVSILYTVWSQAPSIGRAVYRPGLAGNPITKVEEVRPMTENDFHFTTTQHYTIYPDGSITLVSSIVSSNTQVVLPRLGYAMKLPKEYNQYAYYGRGPLNNYADRKTGSFVGQYQSTVEEQFVNFAKPQSMGNREEVRWCSLTDKAGKGALFVADSERLMSISALPWSAMQMTLAGHPHQLPVSDGTYLHLDCQVTGLGGYSCGQGGPLEPDCVKGALHQFKFAIRPLNAGDKVAQKAQIALTQKCPVAIVRDRAGQVTITGESNLPILYTVSSAQGKTTKASKPALYDGKPISLKQGGTVMAWYKGEEGIKTSTSFAKIESVPVEIAYVSSEEGPGEVAANLVDGKVETIWHTMYSITVPKFPHWIDFDCNEVKVIKGFTYLPRQDGTENGNIKGYKVEVSMDGKTWGTVAAEGQFANNTNEKKVLFKQPIKGRYLRFTALSSQDGQDFASGAEFTVMAE